jgi:hypothetical protein
MPHILAKFFSDVQPQTNLHGSLCVILSACAHGRAASGRTQPVFGVHHSIATGSEHHVVPLTPALSTRVPPCDGDPSEGSIRQADSIGEREGFG